MQKDAKGDVNSYKQILNFINQNWQPLLCSNNTHKSLLNKICIDKSCDQSTEQYHLLCEKCILSKVHAKSSDIHYAADLQTTLINLIEELIDISNPNTQGNGIQIHTIYKINEQIKSELKGLINNINKTQSLLLNFLSYLELTSSAMNQVILNSVSNRDQSINQFKLLINDILKEKQQNILQENISRLKSFTQIVNNKICIKTELNTQALLNKFKQNLQTVNAAKKQITAWTNLIPLEMVNLRETISV